MPKTETLDLCKLHKAEFAASAKAASLLEIKPGRFLTIEGRGAPESPQFQAAVGAMYGVAYTIKMTRKFKPVPGQDGPDYKVAPLEGLWWAPKELENLPFLDQPREQWEWKVLIRTPDFVLPEELERAMASLREKGKGPEAEQVKLETFEEGRCVQMLHVGPYAEEPITIEKMIQFAQAQGLTLQGRHHEIYLSDPHRTKPEKLKTILRHPVK